MCRVGNYQDPILRIKSILMWKILKCGFGSGFNPQFSADPDPGRQENEVPADPELRRIRNIADKTA